MIERSNWNFLMFHLAVKVKNRNKRPMKIRQKHQVNRVFPMSLFLFISYAGVIAAAAGN